MTMNLSTESLHRLFEVPNYRSFIQIWMNERGKIKRFGYADIARLGGFSARSFPRDVTNGLKRLTLTSLPKFAKGLQLNGEMFEYFRILVEIEHVDCRTKITDPLKLQEMKLRLQERILVKSGKSRCGTDEVFKVSSLPEVYAALGSIDVGASVDEIATRISLPRYEIEAALGHMVTSGIALKKRTRYFPSQTHLSFEGLKQSEIFKKHFVWSSERSTRMAKTGLNSDSNLFLSSAFSVNRTDIPKLKEELRNLLLKFVDAAETTNGNKVLNIVASLF